MKHIFTSEELSLALVQVSNENMHIQKNRVSQGDLENRTVFAFGILQQQNKTNRISVAPEMYICLIGSINK